MNFKKLVCMGDSITEGFADPLYQGWPVRLAASRLPALNKGEDVWSFNNFGCGGDTIMDAKHRLPQILLTASPTHLVMAFGTNDASTILWPEDTGNKISLVFCKKTWLVLLDSIRKSGVKLAIVGVLPVWPDMPPFVYCPMDAKDKGYLSRNDRLLEYNDMLRDVCTESGVLFIDLYADWLKRDLKQILCDGIHPSKEGYDLLAAQIGESLDGAGFWA